MRPMIALVIVSVLAPAASATVIFEDSFETLDERWVENIHGGEGTIEIVEGGVDGKCLKVTSQGATVYLTTDFDPQLHAGTTVEVTGMVKLDNVIVGPRDYSTAKFHIGETPPKPRPAINHAERWLGTSDWAQKKLTATLDEDSARIWLDLGIQGGTGTVYFDNLVVKDTFGKGRPVSLKSAANTGRSDGIAGDGKGSFLDLGVNDLYHLPQGNLETDSVTFYVPKHGDNGGQTCVILKGEQRPDFPEKTEPIPVGKRVGSLGLLHASAFATDGDACLTYTITYGDGESETLDIVAGTNISNFDQPRDLEASLLVWHGTNGAGAAVGAGMVEWKNPRPDVAIESITITSAGNGVPIVLAITHVPAR